MKRRAETRPAIEAQKRLLDQVLISPTNEKSGKSVLLDVLSLIAGVQLEVKEGAVAQVLTAECWMQPHVVFNHRFQFQIWLITQQVYEILCETIKNANSRGIQPDRQQ